jgi:penicillin-insensitive murein endopeptidase
MLLRLTAALLLAAAPGGAEPLAKDLFGAAEAPSQQAPAPHGAHAAGCLAGAVEIPETGPGWQAVRLSRNRNWGHPEALSFLTRLAAAAREAGWPRLLVGDVSQPRGGPMTSGHASHQIGLDLDVWLRPGPEAPLSRAARETIGAASVVSADRRGVNANWTAAHRALLRAAAEDAAVDRIFVNAAMKAHLCRTEPPPRAWLRRLRPWWGHEAHMHVRLACPARAPDCEGQRPPPPGEGCDETLAWWFTDEALNPPPPQKPVVRARDVMTLADLPPACRGVLDAR